MPRPHPPGTTRDRIWSKRPFAVPWPTPRKSSSPFGRWAATGIGTPISAIGPTNWDQMQYGPDGGKLCRLNLRTGQETVLLDDPQGGVRDPHLHYDGKKILFSYRKGGSRYYHLYEINVDGSGLRQITDGPFDDIEPIYLPDGDIVFCSSRCNRWVQCWFTQVAVLYRCDADGERHPPALLQRRAGQHAVGDARRTRALHALGIRRPQPRPVPSSLDDQPRRHRADDLLRQHARRDGDARRQADSRHQQGRRRSSRPATAARNTPGRSPWSTPTTGRTIARWSGTSIAGKNNYRDPYPLSEDLFLVAEDNRLLLIDGDGRTQEIYRTDEPAHDCCTSRGRSCPTARAGDPAAIRTDAPTGRLILADVTSRPQHGGREAGRDQEAARAGDAAQAGQLQRHHGADQLGRHVHAAADPRHGACRAGRIGLHGSAGAAAAVLRRAGRERHVRQAHAELHQRDAQRDDQLRRLPRASSQHAARRPPA